MRIGVIADDLTGANGTGVMLTKLDLQAFTAFNWNSELKQTEHTVISLDTDSRYLPTKLAEGKITDAFRFFTEKWRADLICKRIDSTFRGNIGVEVERLLRLMGEETMAILVPTYPMSNRTVIKSHLYVDDVPLHETDVAQDPIQPINDSNIFYLLQEQTDLHVAAIHMSTIRLGFYAIKEKIRELKSRGARVVICDAITEEDISYIAKAMTQLEKTQFLPVDPGPLTYHFIKRHLKFKRTKVDKVLATVGSMTTLTARQIAYAQDKLNLYTLELDAYNLIKSEESAKEETSRVVEIVKEQFASSDVLLITTNFPKAKRIDFRKLSTEQNISEDLMAKRLTDALAQISISILRASNGSIKHCYFSGGDVSASFMKIVKAEAIELKEEVIPIVTYGKIVGGEFAQTEIITKGGLIGSKDTLYRCIKFLQNNK